MHLSPSLENLRGLTPHVLGSLSPQGSEGTTLDNGACAVDASSSAVVVAGVTKRF